MKNTRTRKDFRPFWYQSRTAWIAAGCCGVCGLKPSDGCTCSTADQQWVRDEIFRIEGEMLEAAQKDLGVTA